MEHWNPKTDLGRKVKARTITDINDILDNGYTILEPEIADTLLPEMESDLLLVGQSKGKFGGGRRRVFRQTQKKTREGNKPRFAAYAVVGNKDGIVGLGYGKARETVPAREKAMRQAKINVFKIARGSGSWEGTVKEPHTVPFTVEGKCGSVVVRLIPAPKGKGLIAEKEIQKILGAAGIEDVWTQTFGQTKNKINLIKATEKALKKLTTTKLRDKDLSNLSVHYGNTEQIAIKAEDVAAITPKKGVKKPETPTPKKAEKPAATKQPTQPAKEPAQEQKPAATKQAGGTPLSEVAGVGPARVKKLDKAEITTAEALANANPEQVAAASGMSESIVNNLVSAAKEHLGGKQ